MRFYPCSQTFDLAYVVLDDPLRYWFVGTKGDIAHTDRTPPLAAEGQPEITLEEAIKHDPYLNMNGILRIQLVHKALQAEQRAGG